jgi:folate-binding protein YgfZ
LADTPDASLAALEVLRIEAGVPRFLVDMAADTIPLEAGLEDRAISFTKGCYVGQEIIVRVTTRGGGRVARRLVGLLLDRTADPAGPASGDDPDDAAIPMRPAGYPVHAGERAIGQVTSLTRSPLLDRWIALATIHRDFTEPGTAVAIALPGNVVPATVHVLPFVGAEHPAHQEPV